eukprot:jgi/Chlat1/7760/Chrsp66S07226
MAATTPPPTAPSTASTVSSEAAHVGEWVSALRALADSVKSQSVGVGIREPVRQGGLGRTRVHDLDEMLTSGSGKLHARSAPASGMESVVSPNSSLRLQSQKLMAFLDELTSQRPSARLAAEGTTADQPIKDVHTLTVEVTPREPFKQLEMNALTQEEEIARHMQDIRERLAGVRTFWKEYGVQKPFEGADDLGRRVTSPRRVATETDIDNAGTSKPKSHLHSTAPSSSWAAWSQALFEDETLAPRTPRRHHDGAHNTGANDSQPSTPNSARSRSGAESRLRSSSVDRELSDTVLKEAVAGARRNREHVTRLVELREEAELRVQAERAARQAAEESAAALEAKVQQAVEQNKALEACIDRERAAYLLHHPTVLEVAPELSAPALADSRLCSQTTTANSIRSLSIAGAMQSQQEIARLRTHNSALSAEMEEVKKASAARIMDQGKKMQELVTELDQLRVDFQQRQLGQGANTFGLNDKGKMPVTPVHEAMQREHTAEVSRLIMQQTDAAEALQVAEIGWRQSREALWQATELLSELKGQIEQQQISPGHEEMQRLQQRIAELEQRNHDLETQLQEALQLWQADTSTAQTAAEELKALQAKLQAVTEHKQQLLAQLDQQGPLQQSYGAELAARDARMQSLNETNERLANDLAASAAHLQKQQAVAEETIAAERRRHQVRVARLEDDMRQLGAELEQEVQHWQQELAEVENLADERVRAGEARVAVAQEEAFAAEAQLKSALAECTRLRQEAETFDQLLQTRNKELHSKDLELSQSKDKHAHAMEEIDGHKLSTANLVKLVEERNVFISSLQQTVANLEEQLLSTQKISQTHQMDHEELTLAKEDLEDVRVKYAAVVKEYGHVKMELEHEQQEHAALQLEAEEYVQQLQQAQTQLAQAQVHIEELGQIASQIKDLSSQHMQHEVVVAALRDQLATRETTNAAQVAGLQQQIQELSTIREDLLRQLASSQQDLETLEAAMFAAQVQAEANLKETAAINSLLHQVHETAALQLEAQTKSWFAEKAGLEEKLNQLVAQQSEASSLHTEHAALLEQYQALQQELKDKANAWSKDIAALTDQLHKAEEQQGALEQEFAGLRTEANASEQQQEMITQQLQQEKDAAQQHSREWAVERAELQHRIQTLEGQATSAQTQLEEVVAERSKQLPAVDKIAQQGAKIQQLQEEVQVLQQQLQISQTELQNVTDDLWMIKEDNQMKDLHCNLLSEKLVTAEGDLQKAKLESEQLRADLAALGRRLGKQSSELTELRSQLRDASTQLSSLQAELNARVQRVAHLEQQLQSVSAAKLKILELESSNVRCAQDVAEARSMVRGKQQQVDAQGRRIAALEGELMEKEGLISILKESMMKH